jgi:hypothetical protein
MKILYSLPGILLVGCVLLISAVAHPVTWIDHARVITVAMTLFAAVCTGYIFWRTRRGIDKIPPMAFAILLLARAIGHYDLIGDPTFHWYSWPATNVVDIMVIFFVFWRYGRVPSST